MHVAAIWIRKAQRCTPRALVEHRDLSEKCTEESDRIVLRPASCDGRSPGRQRRELAVPRRPRVGHHDFQL